MPELILPEVQILLERYEQEPTHVEQVVSLADRIFLDWAPWHGRGARERLWLGTAAWLHDIGWSQTPDGRGHHKASARLIREFSWQSLPPNEVAVVAQIARYHRQALPGPQHEDFHKLAPGQQRIVEELAGILRVADGLDRTHGQVVTQVSGRVEPKRLGLQLRLKMGASGQPELMMAQKKADLVERASGRMVVLTVEGEGEGAARAA